MLSRFLYSMYTHDCMASHSSNSIMKFADDMTVVGLITNSDEAAYREEVGTLTAWCQVNNLSLNVSKELIVNFRRIQAGHAPINTRCRRKAKKIIRDHSHPNHALFSPLQSIRRG